MKHGVFLVRNYEKMKARQAFLLREGAREQEKEEEDKSSGQQSEGRDLGEDPTIKSGLGVCVVVGDMCMCVCICYLFSLHHIHNAVKHFCITISPESQLLARLLINYIVFVLLVCFLRNSSPQLNRNVIAWCDYILFPSSCVFCML